MISPLPTDFASEKFRLASEDLTGLWSSESSYRKSVSKFIDAAESSHQKAAGLARQLREESERYRALSKRRAGGVSCSHREAVRTSLARRMWCNLEKHVGF